MIGMIIFPYLFVISVSFFVDFFDVKMSTALNIYLLPKENPMIEPSVEPMMVAKIARVVFMFVKIAAARIIAGESI